MCVHTFMYGYACAQQTRIETAMVKGEPLTPERIGSLGIITHNYSNKRCQHYYYLMHQSRHVLYLYCMYAAYYRTYPLQLRHGDDGCSEVLPAPA